MEKYDVVVVGAGPAGLAAGATAAGAGVSTLMLDAHQPGGRSSTDERGVYRFNRGPHGFFHSEEATAVLGRLGVPVPPGAPPPVERARCRLGDRIAKLPGSTRALLTTDLLTTRGKVAVGRVLAGAKRWRPDALAGLTIGQWIDDLRLPDDARALLLLLVRTTAYVHDEDLVSADVAASQLRLGMAGGVRYLHGGFASLVDGLATAARRNGADLRSGSAVTSVIPSDHGVTVLAGGREISAGAAVLAAGGPDADAALLDARPAAWEGLGPKVEASCLDLGLRTGLAEPVLYGIDPPLYLADQAYVTEGLAPAGHGLVHVLRYLPLGDDTPAETLRESMEEHARVAGVDPAMIEEQRFLRRMTVVSATPTPATGGLAGRPGIDSTGVPGVYVAGDWVGPRGWLSGCALSSGEAAGLAAAQETAEGAGTRGKGRPSVPTVGA